MVKNPPANAEYARDVGSTPELGRPPGVGNGNPPQFSCLENPMDRGAWQAIVHGVAKSWTPLSAHTEQPIAICAASSPIPVGGHTSCFHVTAIVNSAAVNTGVCVSFQIMIFSGYMPRIDNGWIIW